VLEYCGVNSVYHLTQFYSPKESQNTLSIFLPTKRLYDILIYPSRKSYFAYRNIAI